MGISSFLRVHYLEEIGGFFSKLMVNIIKAQKNTKKELYLAAIAGQGLSDKLLGQMVHIPYNLFSCANIPPDKVFRSAEFSFFLFIK